MENYNQYFKLCVQLLDQAWPMDPCRQVSVKLLNLKDDQGRVSETPHFTVMNVTGGSSKLGGNPQMKGMPNAKQMSAPPEPQPYKANTPMQFTDQQLAKDDG